MMEEVLTRRYKKARVGAIHELPLPQLTIVDVGKGQLGVALKVMKGLGIKDVDVIALAKARSRDRSSDLSETQDRGFVPGKPAPILLATDSAELLLLGGVRDEAHRFAITYHKKLRQRQFYRSPLDEIPGIGPARKARLMKCFGSIENIRQANLKDLKELASLPARQAELIYHHFHKDRE